MQTPTVTGPPSVASGRAREAMRFGRKACFASFVASIAGQVERTVRTLIAIDESFFIDILVSSASVTDIRTILLSVAEEYCEDIRKGHDIAQLH